VASAARERGCGDRESELTGVFGRLVPSGGLVAILDQRIVEKGYGRRFLASLPPARLVHEVDEVEKFFAQA